ncbi:MAG: acetylxylan esterase [Akkermansiaceae bacterium]|nr:acetylxylan esterase [Armatimonadota bacterium]
MNLMTTKTVSLANISSSRLSKLTRLGIVLACILWGGALTGHTHCVRAQSPSPKVVKPLPVSWDWAVLGKAPKTYEVPKEWEADRPGVRALLYDGLPYKGKPTKVFAWLGIPDHKPGEKVPAVVFIHGGGGTADDNVVNMWVKRGYACISIDDVGSYPNAKEKPDIGGPRGNGECFEQVNDDPKEQWMYHAVGQIALANSLLRSMPEIDANKIGITGLSWGGVVTSVVAGVDHRFKWAAPVYGGAHLEDSEFFKPVLAAFGTEKWIGLWDAQQYLPHAKMPMLWITGTNDDYFQMPEWQKSYRLPQGPRTILLNWRMVHAPWAGSDPKEIEVFADSIVRGGEPLPRVGTPKRTGTRVTVPVESRSPIVKAELTHTADTGAWSKRDWKIDQVTVTPDAKGRTTVSGTLPTGTRVWYVRVEDSRGVKVSSDHEELSAPL